MTERIQKLIDCRGCNGRGVTRGWFGYAKLCKRCSGSGHVWRNNPPPQPPGAPVRPPFREQP